jgi:hypothetical protein
MAPPPSHVQQQPVLQQPTAPAPAPAPAPAQPKRHRK